MGLGGPTLPSAGARGVGAAPPTPCSGWPRAVVGPWLCGFLEPLLGPQCSQLLLAVGLRRALVKTEKSLTEEQPSASPQLSPSSPKPLIHNSSVSSLWREKYSIQSTGKCFWKTLPRRKRYRVFVCMGVVCVLPSFLLTRPNPLPRPCPRRACSPGPQH